MVKMRTKQSPCRYQFSNQIPSLLCKFNANDQIIENSWRNCVPISLVNLSDRMMKSLLQSNLIFLQRNETKLRRARLNRGTRDLRKMTLLRVVSRRIRGYVDILKNSCCWERLILDQANTDTTTTTTTTATTTTISTTGTSTTSPATSTCTATTTRAEYGNSIVADVFRDDHPVVLYRNHCLQGAGIEKCFEPTTNQIESRSCRQRRKKLEPEA